MKKLLFLCSVAAIAIPMSFAQANDRDVTECSFTRDITCITGGACTPSKVSCTAVIVERDGHDGQGPTVLNEEHGRDEAALFVRCDNGFRLRDENASTSGRHDQSILGEDDGDVAVVTIDGREHINNRERARDASLVISKASDTDALKLAGSCEERHDRDHGRD